MTCFITKTHLLWKEGNTLSYVRYVNNRGCSIKEMEIPDEFDTIDFIIDEPGKEKFVIDLSKKTLWVIPKHEQNNIIPTHPSNWFGKLRKYDGEEDVNKLILDIIENTQRKDAMTLDMEYDQYLEQVASVKRKMSIARSNGLEAFEPGRCSKGTTFNKIHIDSSYVHMCIYNGIVFCYDYIQSELNDNKCICLSNFITQNDYSKRKKWNETMKDLLPIFLNKNYNPLFLFEGYRI